MTLPHTLRGPGSAAAALTLTLLAAGSARADDTEIFVNRSAAEGTRPNVLFIIDTSESMDSDVESGKAPYDHSLTYSGACRSDRIYWRRGPGRPPACSTGDYIPEPRNHCDAADRALTGRAGLWTGRSAQWNSERMRWTTLDPARRDLGDAHLECETDAGEHGMYGAANVPFAQNGDDDPWTTNELRQVAWSGASVYTLYSANWLNWLYAPADDENVSRLETVKAAARTLVHSIDGVNVGLMAFSLNTQGGMVTNAVADVAKHRDELTDTLDFLSANVEGTPLSETLYEAGQYYAGRAVDYGLAASPFPSVPASRRTGDDGLYQSPISVACQKNYIILLTDGEPSQDVHADSRIMGLPGFSQLYSGCAGGTQGRCLDEMAGYLKQRDLADGQHLNGKQNVITYTVGFGPAVAGSATLAAVAAAGGGEMFSADDVVGLTNALTEIVSDIEQRSSTFTTPSVAVSAFNRLQSSNELYISVFEPTDTARWPGNLKKYALENGRIVDAAGNDAIDPGTGFFSDDAKSLWTTGEPDGRRVEAGGAANLLPAPAERKIYTFIESRGRRDLTDALNAFTTANSEVSDSLLGTSTAPTRTDVIQWARGVDVRDANGDGSTSDHLRFMGDPLHARPVLVTYGNAPGEAVVFTPTNDGFLHATAADTGRELWAFIPQELLGRLKDLYRDAGVADRSYGIDGDIRVLRFDVDRDGVVEAADGDRLYIYFGMRRGGYSYYALDVTDRTRPRMLWRAGATASLGASVLPGIGETWSTPALARVDVGGATQNSEKLVLIFGGGYDDGQEEFGYRTDSSGHRIYMVDAVSGRLLWYAGGPGGVGTPDRELEDMTHSIPARVVVIDTDGNGFADRMYTADTGGRVWRFDIWNGASRTELVTGGVFANLGAAGTSDPPLADTRRFYYAPDVALIQRRGVDAYYNLAIGSGYRGHPLHTGTSDRFYALRDTQPFARLSQSAYDAFDPITESDLANVTSNIASAVVPRDKRGWQLDLELNGDGEKVLAEAVTVGGTILFPTYEPQSAASENPCVPANGINRVYALQADTGRPGLDLNDDAAITDADAWTRLSQTGIAGEVTFAFDAGTGAGGGPGGGGDDGGVDAGPRDALGRRALCLVGVEVLSKCVGPGNVVRAFWQRGRPD